MPLEPTPNRGTTPSPWGKKFLDPRSLLPISIAYEQRTGLVGETVTVTYAVEDASSSDEFDPVPDVTFMVNVTDNSAGLMVGPPAVTATGMDDAEVDGDQGYTVTPLIDRDDTAGTRPATRSAR